MKVVLISGLSGSGKSVAIRALEDAHFYCVDNLPPSLIMPLIERLEHEGVTLIAIATDSRVGKDIVGLPTIITALRNQGIDLRCIFLDADDETLATRYSETRRRHPMSDLLGEQATVSECIQAEREALSDIKILANTIDTTGLLPNLLRKWTLESVSEQPAGLTLIFETFAYKGGVPSDADLVFDVRCLSNPHYDKNLRPLTGLDQPVREFIQADSRSAELLNDIEQYLRKWLPHYLEEQRSYVTVAIGCTGGQHRSVYIADTLANRLEMLPILEVEVILRRHRNPIVSA